MMKTHWKKHFNYEYLGVYSLPEGQDIVLTIKSVQDEEVVGQSGKKEKCCIVRFSDHDKGMVLNRTNAKTIEKIHKTPYVEDWAGKKIQIYRETGIRAFGTVTDGLRVRDFIPKEKNETEIIFGKVRAAFRSYKGSDREQIGAMLAEKKKAGEITIKFLQNTLKTLQNG